MRARSVELVRRRGGGGAVYLAPGNHLWLDAWVPRDDPLWSPDVSVAAAWVGRWWVEALGGLGLGGGSEWGPASLSIHAGRSVPGASRIVEARRASVAHRKRVLPDVALKMAVEKKVAPPRDFPGALAQAGKINIISELKKASPSRGVIREEYAPAVLAASLEEAGAAALSVLTEEDFFSGSLGDLKEASRVTKIPILRKDFIVDPWQVWETRAAGADSFLLIAAVLNDEETPA